MHFTSADIDRSARQGKLLPVEKSEEDPKELFKDKILNMSEKVVITDCTDADGLGCATLYKHKWGDNVTIFPAGQGNYGFSPHKALTQVGITIDEGKPIYITDLGQNKQKGIPNSEQDKWVTAVSHVQQTNPIYFRDHHETDEELIRSLKQFEGVDYKHTTAKCATKIVLEHDYPNCPDYLKHFAEVTNARDMFIEDSEYFEKSEDLSNAAYWLPFDEYIRIASDKGVNLSSHDDIADTWEKRVTLREKKLQWVMNTKHETSILGFTVASVFGDCYHSEAGRRMLNSGADIAMILKPSGKVSFRSKESLPISNVIAEKLGGGGHACAASTTEYFDSINTNKDDIMYAEQEREQLYTELKEVLNEYKQENNEAVAV